MDFTPWRDVESWSCLRCSRCCIGFKVKLLPYEYARIFKLRPDAITLERFGNPFIRRIDDRCIFLNADGLCTLHPLDMKPLACKIWPFAIYNEPKKGNWSKAEFHYNGGEYYVYFNPLSSICPGINRGHPEKLKLTIAEAIEISLNPLRKQRYSTSGTYC